jgi:uncharacterized protein (TIGR03435 family)
VRHRCRAIAFLTLTPLLILRAQDVSRPAFETATIKESAGPSPGVRAPDRFSRPYITLSQLLTYAYGVLEFQIEGGPKWVREQYFDVQAKAEGRPTADQMRVMVRRLLAERFNLTTHVETRDLPRYALVMARTDRRLGPRLKPSAIDCPAIVAARGPDYRLPPLTGPPQPGDPPRCTLTARVGGGSTTMFVEGQPMREIAKLLQSQAVRIVIDNTGLTGTFDMELETEPRLPPGIPSDTFGVPREGLSLFTALPEQLGLKLESERGPVEILVIDRVELPTAN